MRTIIIDDEQIAINSLLRMLNKIDPHGTHEGVLYTEKFMEYIEENDVDVAFIDVDLYGTNGMNLAQRIADKHPDLNIVIYTGHPDYKSEAMDLFVSAYLVKPVSEEELRNALSHLRYPVKSVNVQCFGHFEVYVNDKPLKFERRDSKEVLAYLIDRRGAEVSDDELRYLLWSEEEDTDKKKVYIRNIIYDIRGTFANCGVKDIILSRHGHYNIDITKVHCDYYDYLAGKNVRTAKLGEYMEQFSTWSGRTKFAIFG